MQVLQWLFKITPQDPPKIVKKDDKDQTKGIVVLSSDGGARRRHHKRVETSKLNCDNLLLFRFLQRKDVSKSYFHHTLNLKAVGCFQRRRHSANSMKTKNGGIVGICNKADLSASHVGNKVLPITDLGNNQCSDSEKKAKAKGDKTKPISRIKELMSWATFANGQKSGKHGIGDKMLNLKKQAAIKAAPEDDELSIESPKISFRWDMESSTTTSSVYSTISKASFSLKNDQIEIGDALDSTIVLHQWSAAKGNWITTDSEFVVLEL